jgi:membrane protease YdiL (CAAX protease family)
VIIAANVIAAVLFAAGHHPATIVMFGELTPLILFRCFLLNGGFGLVFGYFYQKYGIQYAMISHAGCHIISKIIWLIFI